METGANDSQGDSQAQMVLRLGLVVLVLGLCWRVGRFLMGFPMWGDEAFIVDNLYSRDFAGMFAPLEYQQIAPLGFMWAELAAARVLGTSVWALRMPAFVCGLFSLLVFWRFARRRLDPYSGLLAVAIFAASYYVVRHSSEVKPYAGDLAVSLALICLGWAVYCRSDSIARWLGLIMFAGAGVWLSYPAVFIGGAVAMLLTVMLWQQRSRKVFAGWAAYVLIFGGSFLVMYLLYAKPHAEAAQYMVDSNTWNRSFPPFGEPWRLPLWFLKVHTGNMLAYPLGGKNFGSTLTFLLVVTGIVSLWRNRRGPLLVLLLGPLVLMVVAAAMKKYPYGTSARVSQHMAPAFCLLAGVGLSSALHFFLKGRRLIRGLYVATTVMAVIAVVGMVTEIVRPWKKFSDRANLEAMRVLADWTAPGDQWVVFNATETVAYAPDIRSWGGSGARFRYYVRRFGPENVRWAPPVADVLRQDAERIWLIIYRDNKNVFPQELLEAYLQAMQQRLGEPRRHPFKLTSAKDPPRSQVEAIEVYEFPKLGPSSSGT